MVHNIPAFEAKRDFRTLIKDIVEQSLIVKVLSEKASVVIVSAEEWGKIQQEKSILYTPCICEVVRKKIVLTEEEQGWFRERWRLEDDPFEGGSPFPEDFKP